MEGEKPRCFGRSRGRVNRETPTTVDITQLEDSAQELVPLMRARGRSKCSTTLPPTFHACRPGEQAWGVHSSIRDGVRRGAGATGIASDSVIEEGLSALDINPINVSSGTKTLKESMLDDDSSSEQGKVQIKPLGAVKRSVLSTKPEDVLSKKGTTGRVVELQTNYFRLPTVTNWQLYQYRVDFKPEEDSSAEKKRIVREFKEMLGGYLFDGTMLYTPHKYQKDPMTFFSTRPSDNTKICVTVQTVGLLAFGDYHYVQFFNILMRHILESLKLQLVGRYYYDPSACIKLDGHQLEVWPGYVTSIRQHENELLLCAEVTHKVMRHDTAYSLLERCCRSDSGNFQKYKVKIRDLSQPMLVSLRKKRNLLSGQDCLIYLVPELCCMTGLSEQMRKNFLLMRDLADCTRLVPSQRMDRLQHFNRCLKTNSMIAEELKNWNMELSEYLLTLSGRILPSEKIILGSEVRCGPSQAGNWTRELCLHPLLVPQEIDSWAVIVPNRQRRDVGKFISALRAAGCSMELRFSDPAYMEVDDIRIASYVKAIDNVLRSCNPRLIFVVLPSSRLDLYSAIKKKCCVECPIPTQMILNKNLTSRNIKSIATKVAIQINCKIGGAPWTVDTVLQGLMVVGMDVCNDTTQGTSISVLVASLNKPMSQYFSAVSIYRTSEELTNKLSANFCGALRKYIEHNQGCLPQRIVIYRDGVGEGQIPYVYEHEVGTLKMNLEQMYGGKVYKMAFIIVTKRINTRLFCDGNNPPPGTVVDDVITLPERYDFFLVSQSVQQGTVSPTSYNVISDNLQLEPDKLQRLTYKLTHLYFNWSGTVRVPAPCQYAHKLAYLVGQAIHKTPSSKLDQLLYFL
ncbi:hypothetical protein B7P43_G11743 [Cryptotermes secundus]|uniref:Piwi domain-containing protein n=1 Tax=Cryptotermes secundus TaxID=105785 RepID=A0A2J7QB51_9NEOP|nr:hypothetical protein B7P43_G11743 [Cryptotermes secundus]